MKFNILVTGSLYSTQSGYSAWQFCQSAVSRGHSISQVFFYQDGVTQANALSQPLQDEFEPVNAWADFASVNNCELLVCVSSGERRGILGAEQADEFGLKTDNLHAAFSIAGLGRLHEASLSSDRTVSFK